MPGGVRKPRVPGRNRQLLPFLRHLDIGPHVGRHDIVWFADTMLVSPESTPQGDVFERRDNYYVYLKPFGIADEAILNWVRFPGKPPVRIPIPPD